MLQSASLTIRLHPQDDVVIARQQLVSGTVLRDENITVAGLIPPGHKVATRKIMKGQPMNSIISGRKTAPAVSTAPIAHLLQRES